MDHLSYLFALEQFGIKFGLQNIASLVDRLGHPERAFRVVHVAGTNGKGSVTAMIDRALRADRRRSARYTSPHLVDLRERFVIDGESVAPAALDAAIGRVRGVVAALRADGTLDVEPTFFEVTTAIAFELFREAGVEIAVVEVGLGGRLDATNVVRPDVTAITSIALDHQQYLGRTIPEIAFEKAGIIKTGVPIIVGRLDAQADAVVVRVAAERGAPLVRAWDDADVQVDTIRADHEAASVIDVRTAAHRYGPLRLALRGAHQVDNALVALRVLEQLHVAPDAIATGLEQVSWPGRLDVRSLPGGRQLILDAAHNPAGAAALASYLRARGGDRLPMIFGAMRDKDADGMFRALLPMVSALVVTRASSARAADPAHLAARARAVAPSLPIEVAAAAADALERAWRRSPAVVAAGSIFLIGDILAEIDQ